MNFKKILPIAGIGLIAFLLLGKNSGSTNEPSVSSDGGFTPFTMETASDSGMASNSSGTNAPYNITFEAPGFGQSILPSGNAIDSTDTKKSAQTPASSSPLKSSASKSPLIAGRTALSTHVTPEGNAGFYNQKTFTFTDVYGNKSSVAPNYISKKEVNTKQSAINYFLGRN